MRLGYGRNARVWKRLELCIFETLAWWVRCCSRTCDIFSVALDGLVSIRPSCWSRWLEILKETLVYGSWKIISLEGWLKREMVTFIQYMYLLYLRHYSCLDLRYFIVILELLFWLLLIFPAWTFEYL